MSEAERAAASDDPTVLATLIRRAEEHRAERAASGGADADDVRRDRHREPAIRATRRPARRCCMNTGVMTLVAYQFLLSSSVSSYFTVRRRIARRSADQPDWVGETFDPGSAPESTPAAAAATSAAAGSTEQGSTAASSAAASTVGFGGGGDGGGGG